MITNNRKALAKQPLLLSEQGITALAYAAPVMLIRRVHAHHQSDAEIHEQASNYQPANPAARHISSDRNKIKRKRKT